MILDSKSTACFRVLREKELCPYGEHHTKLQIMEIYDRMRHAIDTGEPYQTLFCTDARRRCPFIRTGNSTRRLDAREAIEYAQQRWGDRR